jgi:hypothetical protein
LTAGVPVESKAIALSRDHACAIVRDHVECWGEATSGQLGDGTRYMHSPAPVAGIDDAVSLGAGESIVCAGRKRGGLTCWGQANGWDRMPEAGTLDIPATGPVDRLTFARFDMPCIRSATGWSCWEFVSWRHKRRQDDVADDVFARRRIPIVSMSPDGSCAIDLKGRLGCFRESYGLDPHPSPAWAEGHFVKVTSPVRLGSANDTTTTACARTRDGLVRCFRVPERGAQLEPMDIPGVAAIHDATLIVASRDYRPPHPGSSLVCAVTRAGVVYCWGDGRFGQLGGPSGRDLVATRIDDLPPAVDLAVAGSYACARTLAGRVYCWGSNRNGGAPNGVPAERKMPVRVLLPAP